MSNKTIVLIVEDEPIIRMDVTEWISDAGFVPLEAATADEALSILQERGDIDVVFTDVNMPETLDGFQLSRMVADRWPAVRIVVTSGMARPQREDLTRGALFFPKPYNLDHLVRTIKTLTH